MIGTMNLRRLPLIFLLCLVSCSVLVLMMVMKVQLRGREYVPAQSLTYDPENKPQHGLGHYAGQPMESELLTETVRDMLAFPSPAFVPYDLENTRQKYFSESGQDQLVAKIFDSIKFGYFVEAGALDGEKDSNTLFLERELRWTGLLIEPSPGSFKKLLKKNRKSYSLNACISPTKNAQEMDFKKTSMASQSALDGFGLNPVDVPSIRVPCFPLYNMLLAVGNPAIDYMSLDVEGAELEVLRAIPWKQVNIRLISVDTSLVPGGNEIVKIYMNDRGYTHYKSDLVDGFYFREDLADGMLV